MSTTEKNRELTMQVVTFLEKMKIDVSFKRFTTDNVQIRCPFASISGHREGVDSNPSLGLKITQDGFLWHCFTCGRRGRSLIGFIKELQKYNLIADASEAYRLQNSIRVVYPEFYDSEAHVPQSKKEHYSLEGFIHAEDSKAASRYHDERRRISDDIVSDCRLYFDRAHQQVIFPCYDREEDILRGWVSHYIDGRKPKYSNNFYTGNYLYLEWLARGSTAFVVEGMYDAIRTYQHIKRLNLLDLYSVVGTFGSEVSSRQLARIVAFFDTVVLMGDNDEAGIKLEDRVYHGIRKKLPRVFRAAYIGKDPGEVSQKQFSRVLTQVRPYGVIAV